MDLSSLLTDTTQVVEVYICPCKVPDAWDMLAAGWEQNPLPSIRDPRFRTENAHRMRLQELHHRDLTLSFDLDNDAQRVVRKTLQKEASFHNLWGASYEEEVLPLHRFPPVQELAHEGHVERLSFRINNRMFAYLDKEDGAYYLYVRYQHAPMVDVTKMQEDLERTLARLQRR